MLQYLLAANMIVGALAVLQMGRVLWHMRRAFFPADWRNMTPADKMRLSVAIFHMKGVKRIIIYDVAVLLVFWDRWWVFAVINIILCVETVIASNYALSAIEDA